MLAELLQELAALHTPQTTEFTYENYAAAPLWERARMIADAAEHVQIPSPSSDVEIREPNFHYKEDLTLGFVQGMNFLGENLMNYRGAGMEIGGGEL